VSDMQTVQVVILIVLFVGFVFGTMVGMEISKCLNKRNRSFGGEQQ
jgi:hypothetical protein